MTITEKGYVGLSTDQLYRVGFSIAPQAGILSEQPTVVNWKSREVKHCHCHFIPPHMQTHVRNATAEQLHEHAQVIADHFHKAADFRTTRIDKSIQRQNIQHHEEQPLFGHSKKTKNKDESLQTIYDARHGTKLPGKVVKTQSKSSLDATVNRAYNASKDTYDFYWDIFKRDSIDGKGMALHSTVHYDVKYDNAFWNGDQMVYGDGDGKIFDDFTLDLDVPGHEMTHGVTEHTCALEYKNQSGALNESISDVFGSMISQYKAKQDVNHASWLVGDKVLIGPGALRSMKAPGTAYDTPLLGKDPQPASMDAYDSTTEDEGGVHINSGIPNNAFYRVSMALGGNSWEKAGKIWYATINDPNLKPTANFIDFATCTVDAAEILFHNEPKVKEAVVTAWREVKVLK